MLKQVGERMTVTHQAMASKTHESLLRRLVVRYLVSEGRSLTSFQKLFEKLMLPAGGSVRRYVDSELDLPLIQRSHGGEGEEREPLGLSSVV